MGGFSVIATVKTKISTTFLMVYLEIQVSEMKKLVEEEKVKYIGVYLRQALVLFRGLMQFILSVLYR